MKRDPDDITEDIPILEEYEKGIERNEVEIGLEKESRKKEGLMIDTDTENDEEEIKKRDERRGDDTSQNENECQDLGEDAEEELLVNLIEVEVNCEEEILVSNSKTDATCRISTKLDGVSSSDVLIAVDGIPVLVLFVYLSNILFTDDEFSLLSYYVYIPSRTILSFVLIFNLHVVCP